VSWSTDHGTPLVEDPARVGPVAQLGVDETSFLKAKPSHPTRLVTGLVGASASTMGNALTS
jgi:hypothetical protein